MALILWSSQSSSEAYQNKSTTCAQCIKTKASYSLCQSQRLDFLTVHEETVRSVNKCKRSLRQSPLSGVSFNSCRMLLGQFSSLKPHTAVRFWFMTSCFILKSNPPLVSGRLAFPHVSPFLPGSRLFPPVFPTFVLLSTPVSRCLFPHFIMRLVGSVLTPHPPVAESHCWTATILFLFY